MIALYGSVVAAVACGGIWLAVAGARGVRVSTRAMPALDWPTIGVRVGIGAAVAIAVTATTSWPMAGVSTGAMAAMVPLLLATRRQRDELLDRADALAAWAEMLRDTIASHAGLNQAISMTATVAPRPIEREVRALAANAERMPLADALRRFATDADDVVADLVVAALIIADQHQAQHLNRLLSDIAAAARQQSSMRRRVETGRARTYASVRSIVVITLGMAVGLVVFSPDFLVPYDDGAGQVVLGIIGALFVGAVWSLIAMSRPQPQPRLLAGVEATPGAVTAS